MTFDLVIYAFAALVIVMSFNAGILRSMATIIGYVAAAPFALAVAPALSLFLAQRFAMPPGYSGLVLAGIFVLGGMILGWLIRRGINDLVGPDVSIPDRLAGAAMGAVRIGLVAVLIVVIFDRIIPPNREPVFLKGSMLRPYLSAAGQAGIKALPPELAGYIEQIKRERGI